jgi:hypothetical protein
VSFGRAQRDGYSAWRVKGHAPLTPTFQLMRTDTAPRPFVFTLMPFDREFEDTYRLGIAPACELAGAYCERVDEQIFQESILQRIYNQIAKADLIVADMSGRNPNVFYEVGYAHALGKRVILLTRSADDIPFDLKHYPHIVYNGQITALKSELERRIRWFLEEPESAEVRFEGTLSFYFAGKPIMAGTELSVAARTYHPLSHSFWFDLAVHNPSEQIRPGGQEQLAVLGPSYLHFIPQDEDAVLQTTVLPENQRLTFFGNMPAILPGAWHPFQATGRMPAEHASTPLDLILRVFSPFGPRDLPFVVRLKRTK